VKGVVNSPKSPPPNKRLVGILLFLVCFCGSIFLIPYAHYYRGKIEAYWDIAHGNYEAQRCVHACIALKPTQELERRIFKYANIRIEVTDECGYRMRGYNEVQWARIERLYPGAYDRALNEAIEWDRNRLQSVKE
jgi:hypothetical protein